MQYGLLPSVKLYIWNCELTTPSSAAELSGMSTAQLVKAVYILERRLEAWITTKRKEDKTEREESDA